MNFEAVLSHWLPKWWTNKVMSACIYARSWSTFCDVTLSVRFMPVVVTVRNASSTHKISAACLLSDAGMVKTWRIHKILILSFKIWVLVLAALSLALIFIEWISVWCIPLLNDQRYWSKTFEWNACMLLELTVTTVKWTFLVCVSIYWKRIFLSSWDLLCKCYEQSIHKFGTALVPNMWQAPTFWFCALWGAKLETGFYIFIFICVSKSKND